MVRLAAYGGVSCLLAGYVVLSAFRQRSNFFSAAVYLSKSNACMMILWNFGVFLGILFGRAMQIIFFGPLRLLEIERLHERAWYAVTESLLALTIFREEFDTSFVILFMSLLFLKVFHWLAADRVEMMEQSPSIPRVFHFRMVTVLSTLWVLDILLIVFAAESILLDGPSVMIMFASEYMIMLATLLGTTLKYGVNVHDLRSEVPWENKSVYVFYIDLACDFIKLSTYLCFFSLILTFYGLPLNILRDVYITARSFARKVRDLIRYRKATRNMDERYPNATAEEMERTGDKTCIICREEMEARPVAGNAAQQVQAGQPAPAAGGRQGPNDTPKKLPCGHIFHFHCLRSWLERQQSCPTCRRPVLTEATPASTAQQAAQAAPAQGANQPGQAVAPPAPQPGQAPRPNGFLAVPGATPTQAAGSRPSSRTSHDPSRRPRAGLDNPLVAFQSGQASTATPGQGNRGTSRSNTPLPQNGAPQMITPTPTIPVTTSTDVRPAAAGPTTTDQTSELDERALRRQKIEAAARARSARLEPVTASISQPIPPHLAAPPRANSPGFMSPNGKPLPQFTQQERDLAAIRRRYTSETVMPPLPPEEPSATSDAVIGSASNVKQPDMASTQAVSVAPTPDAILPSHSTATQAQSEQMEMPRLIPLFDQNNPSQPSAFTRFFPSLAELGIISGFPQPSPAQPSANPSSSSFVVPNDLSQDQLAILGEITKEGLETRMKLLSNTQETLQACMRQMQEAMSVLSSGDLQGVLRVVEEVNASRADQSERSEENSMGKGKAREVDPESA